MSVETTEAIPTFIHRVMPVASELELREATDALKQYMAAVLRIHERLAREALQGDSRDLEK
jgi:hypothetical protein